MNNSITEKKGQKRIVIEFVGPQINYGEFPIKRVVGEKVSVKALVFSDSHEKIRAELLYKAAGAKDFHHAEMTCTINDEWEAAFEITKLQNYIYTVRAWLDNFGLWKEDLIKKIEANQTVNIDLMIGSEYVEKAANIADGVDSLELKKFSDLLKSSSEIEEAVEIALSDELSNLMHKYPDKSTAVEYAKDLTVSVSRLKALFSSWYEIFPRSTGTEGKHGTFGDCERLLPDIQKLGFDVLYLSPIHPIGITNKKGANNSTICKPDDPGCPWAIGSSSGGHKTVHSELGSLEDFKTLVKNAPKFGIEIAMDIAFQCSPDHPYVKEHPEWFRWRPDNTVQYAENPPKKYEDILPFNFETEHWKELWEELRSIIFFWIEQGVKIFRIDNPHTKPFAFWEWLISETKSDYPDVIFLSEAFTRPKLMERLAKVGFDQSYTYFTWRNTKWELEQYMSDLTKSEISEYFRPNFWPNTPDILPEYLQYGGRAAFIIRLVLAATLSSNYGIYGPAFELCVSEALEGKEEYLNSEKYQIRYWNRNQPGNIRAVVERVNRSRRENPSLQQISNLNIFKIDNELITAYGKATEDLSNITIIVVSLDPFHKQAGYLNLPLEQLGINPRQPYLLHDTLSNDKYIWQGESNYIELDPSVMPAHILKLHKHMKREKDFDYFI